MLYVNSNNPEYALFRGLPCTIVNNHRDDDLIDVFIPTYSIFILLKADEIESDD